MNAVTYLSYFMIVVLFALGLYFSLSPTAVEWIPGNARYAMGAVFIAYGTIRYMRLRRQIKLNKNTNNQP